MMVKRNREGVISTYRVSYPHHDQCAMLVQIQGKVTIPSHEGRLAIHLLPHAAPGTHLWRYEAVGHPHMSQGHLLSTSCKPLSFSPQAHPLAFACSRCSRRQGVIAGPPTCRILDCRLPLSHIPPSCDGMVYREALNSNLTHQ